MVSVLAAGLLLVSAIIVDAKYCVNPIPGSHKLARGIDVNTLDLMPIDGFNVGGLKAPIISMDCDSGGTWKTNGQTYDKAKSLGTLVKSTTGFFVKKTSKFISNVKELKDTFRLHLNISSGQNLKKLPVSGSVTYKKVKHRIEKENKTQAMVFSDKPSSIINFVDTPQLQIDEHAQAYIDEYLTKPFEDDPTPYEEWITVFGTHYFHQGTFGGRLAMFFEMDNKTVIQSDTTELKIEAELYLEGGIYNFGATFASSEANSKITTDHTSKSVKDFRYYGGRADLLKAEGGLDLWVKTVDADPWLTKGVLRPIAGLMKTEFLRTNLEKAENNYFLKAKRDELNTLLKQHLAQGKISEWSYAQLTDRVWRMYKEQDVIDLKTALLTTQKLPTWFNKDDIKFCYRYKATSESTGVAHCNNKPQTADSCAGVDIDATKLPYYTENTSGKNGCSMQWGLTSKNKEEAWFKKVEICTKWETVGSSSKQCNNAAKGEVCAKVNEFTTPYVDRTSSAEGHCQLSWRLKVPFESPLWIYKTNLCFYWARQSNTETKYCGVGKETGYGSYCVRVGAWTPSFKDNTEGAKNGGCTLAWKWSSK